MKTKTLTVSYGWADPQDATDKQRRYRVEKVTDSVEVDPGQWLTRKEVEILTNCKDWRVTIVPTPND